MSERHVSADPADLRCPDPSHSYLSPIPNLKKIEVHIIVGCSDSRDLSTAFNDTREQLQLEELQKGHLVEIHRESVAGTFITPDIVAGLVFTIHDRIRAHHSHLRAGVPIDFFVHVMTHGNVQLKGEPRDKSDPLYGTLHSVEILPGCATNCGMMHAAEVAEELELQMLQDQPALKLLTPGKKQKQTKQIKSQDDVKALLKVVYGQKTLISAGWVQSIQDLRHHACYQKAILREGLDNDPSVNHLNIHITAGIQNYQDHTYYRLDTNHHLGDTFIDRVYKKINGSPVPDLEQRIAVQAPVLGVFHHSAVSNARATSMALYSGKPYAAGQVFAISGRLIADILRPFGAYKVVGYYYAVKHLGLKEWMVMGRTDKETDMIMMRLENDPLMSYITERFDVGLIPRTSTGMGRDELMQYEGTDAG